MRNWALLYRVVLEILGIALVVAGIWLWDSRAGLIAAGLGCLNFALGGRREPPS